MHNHIAAGQHITQPPRLRGHPPFLHPCTALARLPCSTLLPIRLPLLLPLCIPCTGSCPPSSTCCCCCRHHALPAPKRDHRRLEVRELRVVQEGGEADAQRAQVHKRQAHLPAALPCFRASWRDHKGGRQGRVLHLLAAKQHVLKVREAAGGGSAAHLPGRGGGGPSRALPHLNGGVAGGRRGQGGGIGGEQQRTQYGLEHAGVDGEGGEGWRGGGGGVEGEVANGRLGAEEGDGDAVSIAAMDGVVALVGGGGRIVKIIKKQEFLN